MCGVKLLEFVSATVNFVSVLFDDHVICVGCFSSIIAVIEVICR